VTIAVQPSVISVLDAGPGLAEDEFDLVFERFHRGRAGRAGGTGTGLGLAIARELAREWGGEVTLDNRLEGGAVATLRLKAPS
jgi:two-component system sensor histidine kinase TctE